MATEVVGDDDPYAECRIDDYLYLVIWENGEYGISMEPKEIPQGVVVEAVPAEKGRKGLRQFEVYRDGADTYDLVTVGTFMIDNGYAYVAAHFIHGEAPDESYDIVLIPPFKITYPLQIPQGMSPEKFTKDLMSRVHSDLVKIIKEHNRTKLRVTDFRFCRPYDIDQPNQCRRCKVTKYEGGTDLCDACDKVLYGSPCSDVSSEGCGGDDEVETDNASMYTYDEDNCHELGKQLTDKYDLTN